MRWAYIGVAAAAILLVVLETVLRFAVGLGDPPIAVLDKKIEYRLLPSRSYMRWGNRIEIDRWGMRSEDHDSTLPLGERRIILLGDSVVYGNHFLDQSETIASRLSDIIRTTSPPNCKTLVMAMAASSWGPVNQWRFLQEVGTHGAGAAAIILSAHDLYDTPTHNPSILPYRLSAPATAISDAITIVIERLFRQAVDLDEPSERQTQSLAALNAIVDLFDQYAVKTIIYYHPTRTELTTSRAPEADVFRRFAETRQLPFVYGSPTKPMLEGYRDDIHPNKVGAAAIADRLGLLLKGRLPPCKDS